jgi:hypothetical protein
MRRPALSVLFTVVTGIIPGFAPWAALAQVEAPTPPISLAPPAPPPGAAPAQPDPLTGSSAQPSQSAPALTAPGLPSPSPPGPESPGLSAPGTPAAEQPATVPAPGLPAPPLGENASAQDFLRAAESALVAGRNGEAQEALEMAQTRLLDRSVPLFQTHTPSPNPVVTQIAEALLALRGGDRMRTLLLIQAAIPNAAAKAQ